MAFKRVDWQEKEEITSAKLNDMAQNDNYLLSRKTDSGLLNMNPADKNPRAGNQIIKDNLVIYAGYNNISPTGTSTAFSSRIKFPDGFFAADFLPVVNCTVGTDAGIKRISYLIKNISVDGFTITVREHTKNQKFQPTQTYFLSYVAIGVKGAPNV